MKEKNLRAIPSVDKLLQSLAASDLPRPAVTAVVRRELAELRASGHAAEPGQILNRLHRALDRMRAGKIQPVINGAGILAHTNLGRAPLAAAAVQALQELGANYCNVEYDLEDGERGARAAYLEHNLALLCGAEAATVVNNCAAALVLALRHCTKRRKEVIISRGELIQIGGGFRIPEILEASGARLKEVGATNQTALDDYARAIGPETGLILKVHQSNFYMEGFVSAVSTEELAALAHRHDLPLVEDLGSGAVAATERAPGVAHEPTPAETLSRGVDLITFSGDKLFGGPQAGIAAGKHAHVQALKKEPFFRALRCDKLALGALQATVDLYLRGAPEGRLFPDIPILQMLETPNESLRQRAADLVEPLKMLPAKFSIGAGVGQMGGGALPRSELASVALEIAPKAISLETLAQRLRKNRPPVVGYISGGKFKLDLRTVFPAQDSLLAAAISRALND